MSPAEIELKQRTPRGHLLSLHSKLGKAAVIGGLDYVKRFATSDEFAAIFVYGLDSKTRKAAIETVMRIAERTRQNPPRARQDPLSRRAHRPIERRGTQVHPRQHRAGEHVCCPHLRLPMHHSR